MDKKYLEFLAKSDLTTYGYKILLMLNIKPQNQAQLADELGILRQNVNRCVKDLEARNLIEVDRIEGRNKFYKAVTNLKVLSDWIPGQIKID